MSARRARRSLEGGIQYIASMMDLYDHFGPVRIGFTETANWMVLITIGAFVASVLYALRFFMREVTGISRLVILTVIFFGISAAIFSMLRGILFYIQSSVERSRQMLHSIPLASAPGGGGPGGTVARTVLAVDLSLREWWTARSITLQVVLLMVPGLLFFLLGVASLLATIFGLLLMGG